MLFNSLQFAAFLTGLVLLLLLARGATMRTALLIVASYAFYGAWDARFVPLLMAYTAVAWFAGRWIHATEDARRRRMILAGGVGLSLAGLAFFKYTKFVAATAAALLGLPPGGAPDILLPVGISFFTFEAISYMVDVQRREVRPPRRFLHFALFMAFFPRLVAGPIIRASDFLPQAVRPIVFERGNVVAGGRLFLGGLVLKVVGADNLAGFVDAVYADVGLYSSGTLLFAAVAYAFQIFGDFCGYSLMGIGLARALGFRLPPNFDMPYLATSIAGFWHRWHISLSTWLRDYLYIPLGGSRRGGVRTLVNLTITMVLGGLWHGASWNFVIWGLLHGLALVAHRLWTRSAVGQAAARGLGRGLGILGWAATFALVTALWVPFRSPDFDTTRLFFARVLSGAEGIVWIHTQSLAIMLAMVAWHIVVAVRPDMSLHGIFVRAGWTPRMAGVPGAAGAIGPAAMLVAGSAILLLLMFGQQDASPFIYFHF
jgi:alginate O-acetyltransferase complex protein AlgI